MRYTLDATRNDRIVAPMPPTRDLALELYRRMAPRYDRRGARWPFAGLRRRAVEHLYLKPGQSVMDVGCGTGSAFPLLQEAIGHKGGIIAIDQSPDMLARARERVNENKWENITLIQAPVEPLSRRRWTRPFSRSATISHARPKRSRTWSGT